MVKSILLYHTMVYMFEYYRLQNTDKEFGERLRRCCDNPVVLDCGKIVWSLALGSRYTKAKNGSVNLNWESGRMAEHLLLAAGLNNGRIRVYDAFDGKFSAESIMRESTLLFFVSYLS